MMTTQTIQTHGLQDKLVQLIQVKESPCITIIRKNESPSAANEKLKLKIKNGIKEAVQKLEEQQYDKRLIQTLKARLEEAENQVQYRNYLNGVGLFVSQNILEILYFPMDVQPKVIVDDSFEVRDLLLIVNRTFQYDLLVLNKKKTRFFNGFGLDIHEHIGSDIPEGSDHYLKLEKQPGIDPGKTEAEAMKKYVKALDHFLRIYSDMQMPLILMGDVKLLGYFKNYTRRPWKILGEIQGSYDDYTVAQIREKLKEFIQAFSDKYEEQLLQQVQEDIDRLRYVSGIQEAWTAAAMGEAKTLLTERGYRVPAWSTKDDLFLVFREDLAPDGDYHEDAVDDLVEMVLRQNGKSYFLTPGKLDKFDKVLLTLRFG